MKKLSLTLSGLLLATSALVAPYAAMAQSVPGAGAQTATPPASTTAEPEATEVDEIVVLGKFIPQPMRETSEVAAFVSTEDLARQGDDTAAAALTRVTGLSVANGRFVYVRGLGERYSAALLNGSPLPSPEPLQRVVPLDLFPSSILGSVTVQKTYSVNYPGEFGGGLIDLVTTAIPTEPFVSFGFGFSGNSETTLRDGITHYGGDYDSLGFDDGTRRMPRLLRQAVTTGRRVDSSNYSANDLTNIGRSFQNAPLNLLQRTENVPFNGSFDLAAGRSFDIGGGEFGVVGVIGYDNSWDTRTATQQAGVPVATGLSVTEDMVATSTENDIAWNVLGDFAFEWGDHQIGWTNLYVRNVTKETRSVEGDSSLSSNYIRDDFTAWYQRELIDTQLTGRHHFGDLRIDWRAALARTERDAPYERQIRYRRVNGEFLHSPQLDINTIRFSEVEDQTASAGIDFTYVAPTSFHRDLTVKAGYAWYDNDRYSDQRVFRFTTNNTPSLEFQRQRVDFIYSDFYINPNGLILREVTGSDGAAAYGAHLQTHAVYGQVEALVLPLVRVTAGLRYEDGKQKVGPIDLFSSNPLTGNRLSEGYVLPAATLTWNFAEDRQLRLGASKTIARPRFREQAPQLYFDPETDRLFIGNPYLADSELLNLDARFEWYFERNQYFTAGVFYKDIDKPIEAVVNEGGAGLQQSYLNAPKAVLYGFEVEAKKYFNTDFGAAWFDDKNWLVMGNYTYGKAEVKVEAGDVVFPRTELGVAAPASNFVIDGSRLQGQSEHLANLQFGFEDDAAQSQATILVNYASERTTARGPSGQPDIVQDPGVFVDFVYRKGFTAMGRDLTFSMEARNLLGTGFEEYQSTGGSRIDINRYDLGTSVSFGLTARF